MRAASCLARRPQSQGLPPGAVTSRASRRGSRWKLSVGRQAFEPGVRRSRPTPLLIIPSCSRQAPPRPRHDGTQRRANRPGALWPAPRGIALCEGGKARPPRPASAPSIYPALPLMHRSFPPRPRAQRSHGARARAGGRLHPRPSSGTCQHPAPGCYADGTTDKRPRSSFTANENRSRHPRRPIRRI